MVADNLAELKHEIDKTLEYALSIKINIWDGPEHNHVVQDINTYINLNGIKYKSFSVVVNGNREIDYDLVFDMYLKQPARVSKKQKKKGKYPNMKNLMILHTCTVYER